VALSAVAIDLDGALGDTRPLWREFVADAARRFASIAPLDPGSLSDDRGEAAAQLDRWAAGGIGDWRAALARFAEERAPVYLRPNAEASAALRGLAVAGVRVGVFTDAPEPLARVALAHLGAERRLAALETGAGARERLLEGLGRDAIVVENLNGLVKITRDGAEEPGRSSA
jgi:phosphoglycolate phosphatase-like HAD superfamily hydrolase